MNALDTTSNVCPIRLGFPAVITIVVVVASSVVVIVVVVVVPIAFMPCVPNLDYSSQLHDSIVMSSSMTLWPPWIWTGTTQSMYSKEKALNAPQWVAVWPWSDSEGPF